MINDFFVPFFAIGLAELGDKTQFAILCISLKTKKHGLVLAGALLAFILADGSAVLLGSYLSRIFPFIYVSLFAGVLFVAIGISMLVKTKEENEEYQISKPFLSSFGLIVLLEMGDKSQIAAGMFATQFNPLLVLLGVVTSLFCLSLIAVLVGKHVLKKVPMRTVAVISGVIFIAIGVLTILSQLV